jgi:NADPH2:quinone reductase
MMKDADIRGMVLFNATAADLAAIYKELGERLAARRICPVIGREIPLAAAAESHRAVMAPNALGKIVLIP